MASTYGKVSMINTIIIITDCTHRDRLLQSQVFTNVGSGMNAISIDFYTICCKVSLALTL